MEHIGEIGQLLADKFLPPPPGAAGDELRQSFQMPVPYFLEPGKIFFVPARRQPARGDYLVRDPLEGGKHDDHVPVAGAGPVDDLHGVTDPVRRADGGAPEFHDVHGNPLK